MKYYVCALRCRCGKTIVAGLAISFGFLVKRLYQDYLWIQIAFVVTMIVIGIYLLRKKATTSDTTVDPPQNLGTGFLLVFLTRFMHWNFVMRVEKPIK